MSDFWDDIMTSPLLSEGAIDAHLRSKEASEVSTSVSALTDKGRQDNALPLPVNAGTRVAFVANLGSVLTYSDVPEDGHEGTVVTVRSAHGDTTSHEGRVFVKWDDGVFRSVLAEHLRLAKTTEAKDYRRVLVGNAISFQDYLLSQGYHTAKGNTDLVHKATKDLWSFHKEGEEYIIARLFDDTGEPLKV
jgi:hypothetical protein